MESLDCSQSNHFQSFPPNYNDNFHFQQYLFTGNLGREVIHQIHFSRSKRPTSANYLFILLVSIQVGRLKTLRDGRRSVVAIDPPHPISSFIVAQYLDSR
jgi:hypothetical protein